MADKLSQKVLNIEYLANNSSVVGGSKAVSLADNESSYRVRERSTRDFDYSSNANFERQDGRVHHTDSFDR